MKELTEEERNMIFESLIDETLKPMNMGEMSMLVKMLIGAKCIPPDKDGNLDKDFMKKCEEIDINSMEEKEKIEFQKICIGVLYIDMNDEELLKEYEKVFGKPFDNKQCILKIN